MSLNRPQFSVLSCILAVDLGLGTGAYCINVEAVPVLSHSTVFGSRQCVTAAIPPLSPEQKSTPL